MSNYPTNLDDDDSLPRVDDNNLVEIGAEAINACRDAIFNIEGSLGINPQGGLSSLSNRLNVSLEQNGTIKASALTSIGLATLPIVNNEIAFNAGIDEGKLNLFYNTDDLHTLIIANEGLINSLTAYTNTLANNLSFHISGATFLSDGTTSARHVASQIDINTVPFDPRDVSFIWTGLLDKNGNLRSATNVGSALLQINNDLVGHENATTDAHLASAIIVDTDNFQEIPTNLTNVQSVIDYLDDQELLNLGLHRATQHSNGIPRTARSEYYDGYQTTDGYREIIVPTTTVNAYLVHPPNTSPVDDLSVGDDIVKFVPVDTNFIFDSQFSKIKVGDYLKINYGNGLSANYLIDSFRFNPGVEWIIRINGVNLCESIDGYATARIERALYDTDTNGVLAVAPVNARDGSGPIYTNILTSVIVGNPRSASILGLGFDADQINSTHYKLWLQLFPSGNPAEKVINLPFIDVSGNLGITPGSYTLTSTVQTINDKLRQIGYNYRFLAFEKSGNIGLMLTDNIGNASFSIIIGDNSSGTLTTGTFTENIIGGNTLDTFDALGLGVLGANVASPVYQGTWSDATSALNPTNVILPEKKRFFYVNGHRLDKFASTYLANSDGYWDGYISARTPIGISNIETTYTVLKNLRAAGLKPGKTLTIQPSVAFTDPTYFDVDYGRFIIKSVNFSNCDAANPTTDITVINGLHAAGSGFGFSSSPTLPVRLYFGYDSVGFDNENVIDSGITSVDYLRLFEIYIEQAGKTFSHERARLPRQSETAALLNTNFWHISDVAPKLRGYTDGNPLVFNKYVRFYVDNFDSTTGEFDGYLGKRDPISSNISKVGDSVRTKKNIPTRFYDETNVDYIELIYIEEGVSPGTNILSSDVGRYVDIELFLTLELDPENFLLATVEVNWDPLAGHNIIQVVKNRREFGSISEHDFTESAINFINAGNKNLHANGVIQGLGLDVIANEGEIFFKGGIALVNGKIIAVNNQSITISQIIKQGTFVPQDVDWAICLTENGELLPIIINASNIQWFSSSGNTYIDSATFTELINNRKDLLPIYILTAHIASITINSDDMRDIRRYVYQSDITSQLVLSSDPHKGNFRTLEALGNWAGEYGSKLFVKVQGTFEINSAFDFSVFENGVHLFGEGAVFNINSLIGFNLASNITLENITFNYIPPTSPASGRLSSGGGVLYSAGSISSTLNNITIKNCLFAYDQREDFRYPFIDIELLTDQILENIYIEKNIFRQNSGSTLGDTQPSIALLWKGANTGPALLNNIHIKENNLDKKQGIYISSLSNLNIGGCLCLNVQIKNNECGIIGVLPTNFDSALSYYTTIDRPLGMTIEGNTAQLIGTLSGDGSLDATYTHGLGPVRINNNNISACYISVSDYSATSIIPTIHILGNNFQAIGSEIYSFYGTSNEKAIFIQPNVGINTIINFSSLFNISENIITKGRQDATTYTYTYGMNIVNISANVSNNTIDQFLAAGISALATTAAAKKVFNISGNIINRGTNSVINFITLNPSESAAAVLQGIVKNNIFSSNTIDGSSTATINYIPHTIICYDNKNQTVVAQVKPMMGTASIHPNSVISGYYAGSATSGITASRATFDGSSIIMVYSDTTVRQKLTWFIPVNVIVPPYATIISVSCGVQSLGTPPVTNKAFSITIGNSSMGLAVGTSLSITGSFQTLSYSPVGYSSDPAEGTFIQIDADVNDPTNATNILIQGATITYQY